MDLRALKALYFFIPFFFLNGCAGQSHLNTGAVSMRPLIGIDGEPHNDEVHNAYYTGDEVKQLESAGNLIKAGDSVGIKLLQAFICDFHESSRQEVFQGTERKSDVGRTRRCNYLDDENVNSQTRGEIVILATAFELGSGQKIEFYKEASQNTSARIVYFDDDVREVGQFLNQSNLPIYGPITYEGNPIFLRFIVMELDSDENKAYSQTLSELASLGGKAYPPASPVLKVLDGLGKVFFTENSDDIEFRFDMAFDGENTVTHSHAPLAYGNYLFIRNWDRFSEIPWHEFRMNHQSGRLEYRCTVWLVENRKYNNCTDTNASPEIDHEILGHPGDEYKQFTYFTVKVTKNENALQNDIVQTLAEFQSQPSPDAYDFSQLNESFEKIGVRASQKAKYDQLRRDLKHLSDWPFQTARAAQVAEGLEQALCEPDAVEDALSPIQKAYFLNALFEMAKNGTDAIFAPERMTIMQLQAACEAKAGGIIESIYTALAR